METQCTFASTARARVSCQQCSWDFDHHWRWIGIQCWRESGSFSQCAWFTGLRTGDKETDQLGKQWMGRSRWNWGLGVLARFTDVCSLNSSLKKQPTLSPRNDVWETAAEILYWWRVTTQIWVVLLIGRAAMKLCFNQSEAPHRSGYCRSSVWEFLQSFLRRHFARKPVVGSWIVGLFLRIWSVTHHITCLSV